VSEEKKRGRTPAEKLVIAQAAVALMKVRKLDAEIRPYVYQLDTVILDLQELAEKDAEPPKEAA
jgi:hypothetical protein